MEGPEIEDLESSKKAVLGVLAKCIQDVEWRVNNPGKKRGERAAKVVKGLPHKDLSRIRAIAGGVEDHNLGPVRCYVSTDSRLQQRPVSRF